MPAPPHSHGPADAPTRERAGERARALDVHHAVHVCVHMGVRSSACMCMHTYARMRRFHASVRVRAGVGAWACARAAGAAVSNCVYVFLAACMQVCRYARVHVSTPFLSARESARARRERRKLADTPCVALRT